MPSRRSYALLAACAVAVVACRKAPPKADPESTGAWPGETAAPAVDADAAPVVQDHMHLDADGVSKDVWISGWASIPHPRHREYAFAGPLGCAGQRFKTNLTKNTRLDIGYTAKKAFVIVVEDPYVLDKPPTVEGKTLVWAGNFKNPEDGSTRAFRLRIDCPLPAK